MKCTASKQASVTFLKKHLELKKKKKFRRKFQMNEMLPEERQIVKVLNLQLKLSSTYFLATCGLKVF